MEFHNSRSTGIQVKGPTGVSMVPQQRPLLARLRYRVIHLENPVLGNLRNRLISRYTLYGKHLAGGDLPGVFAQSAYFLPTLAGMFPAESGRFPAGKTNRQCGASAGFHRPRHSDHCREKRVRQSPVFSQCFRRMRGMTPRSYRRKMWEGKNLITNKNFCAD